MQIKPGHRLSEREVEDLADLLARNYPDQDFEIVIDDKPRSLSAPQPEVVKKPGALQNLAVLAVTAFAGLYLINPGAGVIEFIPDVVPVIGNLDEATALALLVSGLGYFGVNIGWITTIFGRGLPKRKRSE